MPKGGKRGHKGQRRHFTSPEQIDADKEKEERKKNWMKGRNEGEEGEDDEDKEDSSNEETSSEESDSDSEAKAKGVSHLIEVSNPNRVASKSKKVSQLDKDEEAKPELSRREREELEKQQAKAKYNALHAAGKTDEARSDLARLAIIRQQRADAARKKQDLKKAEDEQAKKTKS